MASQLDFIVFGPGRSGTTAFAHAFRCHPRVFCATEFFKLNADHSTFRLPADMLRLQLSDRMHRRQSIEVLKEKLLRGDVDFYGNKMPNYYLQLDRLRQELPDLKLFYIYRSPPDFVSSWDRRADRENDKWHEGRLGVFGAIEQVFCLKRLASSSFDVTMVSYESLFFDEPLLMAQVIDRLGANATEFGQAQFEQQIFQKRKTRPEVVKRDIYEEFFSELRFDLVDSYFEANPLARSSDPEFKRIVNDQFARLPAPTRFAEFLRKLGSTVEDFAVTWRRQLRIHVDNREHPAAEWLLRYVAQASKDLVEAGSADNIK